MTTSIIRSVQTALGNERARIDLGEVLLKFHSLIHRAKDEAKLNDVELSVRRLVTNKPRIELESFTKVELLPQECRMSEFDFVSGTRWVMNQLFSCPIKRFANAIRFISYPIVQFFKTIVEKVYRIISQINATISHSLLVNAMKMSDNQIVKILEKSFKLAAFNSNFSYDGNPLAGNDNNQSEEDEEVHQATFQRLCSLGIQKELNCLAVDLLNPNILGNDMSLCLERMGAKTHFRSLDDLRTNNHPFRFNESFDQPPVRFCFEGGDTPLEKDRSINANHYSMLWDMEEIDDVRTNSGYKINFLNQCASFTDFQVRGKATVEDEVVVFQPTLRTNYLINDVLTCQNTRDCSLVWLPRHKPEPSPIFKRATLAACSVMADLWLSPKEQGYGSENLLNFLAENINTRTSQGRRRQELRTRFVTNIRDKYCTIQSQRGLENCNQQRIYQYERLLKSQAQTCLSKLETSGVNTNNFNCFV